MNHEKKKVELLSFMRDEAYKPLSVTELEKALKITDSSEFKEFVKVLNEMEENGLIVRTRSNLYGLPDKMNLVRGKVQANAKGFAFIIPEDKMIERDIYVTSSDLNSAMNGDVVLVRLHPKSTGSRPEGQVIRIVERGTSQVVGTYSENKFYGFVIADDKRIPNDIFIPKNANIGAVDGHKVVVKITKYPEARMNAEGEVVTILGHKNDPGVDILSIIHKHGLPQEFPEEVLEQANAVPEEINPKEIEGRRDLREKIIVTIDGADAKDLDDAVNVEKLENGNHKLGVHIADVSYYVTAGSPIDKEAFERATSCYLVDRVIPMIPHRLSNGICSLNPKVDRLTLSCEMEINPDGKVVAHEIFPSVICTTERMTYTEVRQILNEEDDEVLKRYQPLIPFFKQMGDLATILRKKRIERGAIDFEFKESKVLVDEEGKPTDVVIRERSIAERLIEEFMLCANETIAEHFHRLKVPFMYRIHEDPDAEKLTRFLEFITTFGYVVRGTATTLHPRALQLLLEEVRGEPEETVISKVMLRSMKQAKYDPESVGHFGLSTDFYTHFTSPIRRYPDLIVHRLIRTYLIEGKTDENTLTDWAEKLAVISTHSSEMERRAVEAERDTDTLKKVQFMEDKIGEQFEGMISGVTNFGLFVELENTIEGLVHVSYLTDDYYHYDENQYAMIGERTGNIFRIGDEIEIKVVSVNVEETSIDFEIIGMKPRKERPAQAKPKVIVGGGKRKDRSGTKKAPAGKKPEDKAKPGTGKKKKFYENAPKSKRNRGKKK